MLFKQGKISRERLDEALATQRQTLQRLGHVLAGSSAITSKDLRDALQIQISQIVFRVFRWRDGRYQFAPSDSVDYDRENFAPMSTDFILMEGIRMVDEWPIIEKKISSFDLVFRPRGRPESDRRRSAPATAARTSAVDDRDRPDPPLAEEERVFRKVDGARTVQAIIDSTGSRRVRGLPHAVRLPEPQPDRPGRAGETRAARSRSARRPWSPALPAYALAVLLLARWRWPASSSAPSSPFAVTGLAPVLPQSPGLLRDSVMRDRLARLDAAIAAWRARDGRLPADARGPRACRAGGPLVPARPVARPFHYEPGARATCSARSTRSGRSRADATLDRRTER